MPPTGSTHVHPDSAPIDALAAAAAEAARGTPSGEQPSGSAGKEGSGDWTFPVFVGHRRRLPPDDVLFEAGNIEREALVRQAAVAVARDERLQLSKEAALAGDSELADHLHATFECAQCHAALPTARLLELHVAELHDSFFAAQAARRMPVYFCLVEGCPRKFCTPEERKQHLVDHHKFPRNLHFDRIHLRRRKAQIRPLPQYRKGGHGQQAMAADASAGEGAAAAAAAPARMEEEHAAHDVVQGMSRLSMAAKASTVPNVIHFGRGRGRGLLGVSRGRGVKAPQHAQQQAAPQHKSAEA